MSHLLAIISEYKYILLFLSAIFEGPVVTLVAGTFVLLKGMNLVIVYMIMAVGDVVGDALFYWVGRIFSRAFLRKEKFLFISIKKEESFYDKNPRKFIVLSKLVHGIGIGGIVGAGVFKVPYRTFFTACAPVSFLQTAFFLTLGIFFGKSYLIIEKYMGYFSAVVTLGVLFWAVWYFVLRKKNNA